MLAICGVHVSVHSLWVFIAHHRATLSTSFRLWELLGVQVSELRPYRASDTHELVHREQGTTVPYAGSQTTNLWFGSEPAFSDAFDVLSVLLQEALIPIALYVGTEA